MNSKLQTSISQIDSFVERDFEKSKLVTLQASQSITTLSGNIFIEINQNRLVTE